MTGTAGLPLDGLRVLDLSNFLAAPFLTMLLGGGM
jgi:crotonobetainyl-CoA:carnitine CoA-transferase CaiB-like acyl-CoA transferase